MDSGSFIFSIILFVIYLLLCKLVGKFANKRGRDGVSWSVISAFISPLLAFLIVMLLEDVSAQEEAYFSSIPPTPVLTGVSLAKKIDNAFSLFKRGIYSEAEFTQTKLKSIGNIEFSRIQEDKTQFLSAFMELLEKEAINQSELEKIKRLLSSRI